MDVLFAPTIGLKTVSAKSSELFRSSSIDYTARQVIISIKLIERSIKINSLVGFIIIGLKLIEAL